VSQQRQQFLPLEATDCSAPSCEMVATVSACSSSSICDDQLFPMDATIFDNDDDVTDIEAAHK